MKLKALSVGLILLAIVLTGCSSETQTISDTEVKTILNGYSKQLENKGQIKELTDEDNFAFLLYAYDQASTQLIVSELETKISNSPYTVVSKDNIQLTYESQYTQLPYLSLKKDKEIWKLDILSVANALQASSPTDPIAVQADSFKKEKNYFIPLVKQAVESCKDTGSTMTEYINECVNDVIAFMKPIYSDNRKDTEGLTFLEKYVGSIMSATSFNFKNYLTKQTAYLMVDLLGMPVPKNKQEFLAGFKNITRLEKINDEKYRIYSPQVDQMDGVEMSLVRENGKVVLEMKMEGMEEFLTAE